MYSAWHNRRWQSVAPTHRTVFHKHPTSPYWNMTNISPTGTRNALVVPSSRICHYITLQIMIYIQQRKFLNKNVDSREVGIHSAKRFSLFLQLIFEMKISPMASLLSSPFKIFRRGLNFNILPLLSNTLKCQTFRECDIGQG